MPDVEIILLAPVLPVPEVEVPADGAPRPEAAVVKVEVGGLHA